MNKIKGRRSSGDIICVASWCLKVGIKNLRNINYIEKKLINRHLKNSKLFNKME